MKSLSFILCFFCFLSCSEKKYIKQLSLGDSKLYWYTEYHGLDKQDDFVELEVENSEQSVLKDNSGGIADIELKKDSAVIKMYDLRGLSSINLTTFKNVHIKLDTSVTYNDYVKYHQPEYYNKFSDSELIGIDSSTRVARMTARIPIK